MGGEYGRNRNGAVNGKTIGSGGDRGETEIVWKRKDESVIEGAQEEQIGGRFAGLSRWWTGSRTQIPHE